LTLRTLLALIALGAALSLTACGGSDQTLAETPRLPRAVANELARSSEQVAAALDAGDVCGAAVLADDLENAVEGAIAEGDVPPELRPELEAAAVELQNGINCPPEPEEEEENGESGKGKKNGHDTDADTGTGSSTTTGTTTEEE
jgi:hypothetical protein